MARLSKKPKREPLTVALIAKTLGVSEASVYKAVRVSRAKKFDPLLPLFQMARRNNVSENVATSVITLFKMEGLPGLKSMPKRYNYQWTERGRFATMILSATEDAVTKAIADSEEKRKKFASGVRTRMSKAKT